MYMYFVKEFVFFFKEEKKIIIFNEKKNVLIDIVFLNVN